VERPAGFTLVIFIFLFEGGRLAGLVKSSLSLAFSRRIADTTYGFNGTMNLFPWRQVLLTTAATATMDFFPRRQMLLTTAASATPVDATLV
jgi:hypothetical protein